MSPPDAKVQGMEKPAEDGQPVLSLPTYRLSKKEPAAAREGKEKRPPAE